MNHHCENQTGSKTPNNHLTDDLYLDLLHNLLPKADREKALFHLSCCPDCESAFQRVVIERERLRATRNLATNSAGDLVVQKQLESDRADRTKGERETAPSFSETVSKIWAGFVSGIQSPRNQVAIGLVGAAAVLLMLFWPQDEMTDSAFDIHWLPKSTQEMQFRSSSGNVADENLAEGLDAYARQDLETAIRHLERAEVSGHLETMRRIYLGSALAVSKRYDEAVEILKAASSRSLPDPWGSEARWTLYIALKKSGQTSKADSLLNVLTIETGDIGDRARSLIHP